MLTAPEAVKVFIWVDVEAGRPLSVKRTQSDERSTATAALELDPSGATEVRQWMTLASGLEINHGPLLA